MAFDELSVEELRHARMELEEELRKLKGIRFREGTLEDTLDRYNALVEKCHQIVAGSWAGQAARLRNDTLGNASFSLYPDHDKADKILADHDGLQVLLNSIKAQTYDITLAENQSERNRKVQSIAEIMRELLQRESNQKIVQANTAYETEIAKIKGAD